MEFLLCRTRDLTFSGLNLAHLEVALAGSFVFVAPVLLEWGERE